MLVSHGLALCARLLHVPASATLHRVPTAGSLAGMACSSRAGKGRVTIARPQHTLPEHDSAQLGGQPLCNAALQYPHTHSILVTSGTAAAAAGAASGGSGRWAACRHHAEAVGQQLLKPLQYRWLGHRTRIPVLLRPPPATSVSADAITTREAAARRCS